MRMLCAASFIAQVFTLAACARDPLPGYDASIGDGTITGGSNTGSSSGTGGNGTAGSTGSGTTGGSTGQPDAGGGSSGGTSNGGTSNGGTSNGGTAGEDAGVQPCPDRDADKVCDAEDNCPDQANADQADTDMDGAGNACDPACVADAVPASIDTERVTLSSIRLNSSGQVIDVMRDSTLQLDLSYVLSPCTPGGFTLRQQLLIGFDDGSNPVCAVNNLCAPLNGSAQEALKVPSTPGIYYLLYDVAQEMSCPNQWVAGKPDNAHRIAAICVR